MQKTIITFTSFLGLLNVSTTFIPTQGNPPPLSLTLFLLGFCCLFLLIIGVIVLGFFVRRENRKGEKDN